MNPTAYPLAWPAGKKRTLGYARVSGKFSKGRAGYVERNGERVWENNSRDLTIADALKRLDRELDLIFAQYIVVSTNVELKRDGTPYSGRRAPEDPGVAVYFRLDGRAVVLAADRYDNVATNIAAVAAHVDAMRTAERHGVGSLKQMFTGFAALPPATSLDDWRALLNEPGTLEFAESVYRDKMRTAHPDVGGSEAQAAALNAAIARAREVLR